MRFRYTIQRFANGVLRFFLVAGILGLFLHSGSRAPLAQDEWAAPYPEPFDPAVQYITNTLLRFYRCENRLPASAKELTESPYFPIRTSIFENPYTGKPLKWVDEPSAGDISWVTEDGHSMVVLWVKGTSPDSSLKRVPISMTKKEFASFREHLEEMRRLVLSGVPGGKINSGFKRCHEGKPFAEALANEVHRILSWAVGDFQDLFKKPPASAEDLIRAFPHLKGLRNGYSGGDSLPVKGPTGEPGNWRLFTETIDGETRVSIEVFGETKTV